MSVNVEAVEREEGSEALETRARAISARYSEPQWLLERRLEALERAQELSFPSWRKTRVKGLDIEALEGSGLKALPRAGEIIKAARAGEDASAVYHQADQQFEVPDLAAALKEQGVIFTSIHAAVKEHPDLLREHFMPHGLPADHHQLTARSVALFEGGVFVYVPDGVQLELPLKSFFRLHQAPSMYDHNIIVVGDNARLTYYDEYLSPGYEGSGLHAGYTELTLGDNSSLNFITVQDFSDQLYDLSTATARVGRDSTFTYGWGLFGARLTRNYLETNLDGENSHHQGLGVMFGHGKRHLDWSTDCYHNARGDTSEVQARNVLTGEAMSVFRGLIRIEKVAQFSVGDLQDKTLLLSDEARSDAIPSLEVEADDVKVGHGASTGQVDAEQVFYLMSRGLKREVAEHMVVTGFYEPVISDLPTEGIKNRFRQLVQEHLGQEG